VVVVAVDLLRQPSGFGFRLFGGLDVRSFTIFYSFAAAFFVAILAVFFVAKLAVFCCHFESFFVAILVVFFAVFANLAKLAVFLLPYWQFL